MFVSKHLSCDCRHTSAAIYRHTPATTNSRFCNVVKKLVRGFCNVVDTLVRGFCNIVKKLVRRFCHVVKKLVRGFCNDVDLQYRPTIVNSRGIRELQLLSKFCTSWALKVAILSTSKIEKSADRLF